MTCHAHDCSNWPSQQVVQDPVMWYLMTALRSPLPDYHTTTSLKPIPHTHTYIALRLVWCWRVGPQCDKHTWAAASSWAHPEEGSGPCCCPRLVISVVWPPLGRGARSEGGGRVGSSSCCGCSSTAVAAAACCRVSRRGCVLGNPLSCSICIGERAITSSRRQREQA